MNKVLFVATVVRKHINVFHLPYLKMFKDFGWETSVAARNDFDAGKEAQIPYCDKYYDLPFERFPLKPKNLQTYNALKKLIKENDYKLIHCHTPTGGLLARLAALSGRKKGVKVIYTAHGFHFFKGAPIINWLCYFPVEWLCSFFTDVLITINDEDYAFAKKHMHAKKIVYVPGVGIDTGKMENVSVNREEKRKELGIADGQTMILSVGEVNSNKNHESIVRAIGKLGDKNIVYVICGLGDRAEPLKTLAKELGVNLILPGYRNDIAEICKSCDIYAFPSKREGLSLALMEAMSSGLPIVCSKIRGNTDLVKHAEGGFLYDPADIDGFAEGIGTLCGDETLRKSMGDKNLENIKIFGLDNVKKEMQKIYEEVLGWESLK